LESQEELASQLKFLSKNVLQGLELELQQIVRYKIVSTFEDLLQLLRNMQKELNLNKMIKIKDYL
jgi:hypothetical protein